MPASTLTQPAIYTLPKQVGLGEKLIFRLPLLGRIYKEVAYGEADNIYYALASFISAWGCAVLLFGLPGLYIPAVCLVPVVFSVLVLITLG